MIGTHACMNNGVIAARYTLPGLKVDDERFVRGCISCQRQKLDKGLKAPTQETDNPDIRWATLHVDFATCLPSTCTGNDAVVVYVDKLPRMVHVAPFQQACFTLAEVCKVFVRELVRLYGVPNIIISDCYPFFGSFRSCVASPP